MDRPLPEPPPPDPPRPTIDRRRYRRVVWFFFKVCARLLWWDLLLALPLLRALRTDPLPRWRDVATRYRALAVELGGVLIKLGQYLSTRVDLLPREVTRELAGLQDEVPPGPIEPVVRQIEADLGRPIGELFPFFDQRPLGAASLAQVHGAQLPDGRPAVVKVLRPGIEVLVETDLAALGQVTRWLKWFGFIRRRVDLDWVREEFTATTRRELDMRAEGRHVERFAENFADDPQVRAPTVYWDFTARRTLTEENVAAIKIADRDAIVAAGVDPAQVASKLYRVYMEQIFVHNFVHSDPHPGNLFVEPTAEEPGFRIAFVDFGMVAVVPERLRAAMRKLIIGLGRRDAAMVVAALRDSGSLLPGADLAQLEEAAESVFDRFWGMEMSRMNALALRQATVLWREFGRLLLETPIQAQVDLMFVGRAFEILGGLVLALDPDFNPWRQAIPFAQRLAAETAERDWQRWALELADQAQLVARLPGEISRAATLAQRGRLTVRAAPAPELRKRLERLERSIDRLGTAVFAAAALVAGALLYDAEPIVGVGLMGVAVMVLALSRLLRSR